MVWKTVYNRIFPRKLLLESCPECISHIPTLLVTYEEGKGGFPVHVKRLLSHQHFLSYCFTTTCPSSLLCSISLSDFSMTVPLDITFLNCLDVCFLPSKGHVTWQTTKSHVFSIQLVLSVFRIHHW